MTLVDSSVWIDFVKGTATPQVDALRDLLTAGEALVGDLIVAEVLQGARSPHEVRRLETMFEFLPCVQLVGERRARSSAANYRALRARGNTVRKTIDMLIGSYCITEGLPLLFADRDFLPMVGHLGLAGAPGSLTAREVRRG